MIRVPMISLGRSGSALLASCLNAHPRVSISYSTATDFLYRASGFFRRTRTRPVETHPEMATRRGQQLASWDDVGENARAVLLVRDPRDVICSWWAHMAKKSNARYLPDMGRIGVDHWADRWAAVHDVENVKAANKRGADVFTLRYEDFIEDVPRHVQAVLDYLGITDVINPHALKRMAARLFQVHGTSRKPADSVERWRTGMTEEDAATVWLHASRIMNYYAYPER